MSAIMVERTGEWLDRVDALDFSLGELRGWLGSQVWLAAIREDEPLFDALTHALCMSGRIELESDDYELHLALVGVLRALGE